MSSSASTNPSFGSSFSSLPPAEDTSKALDTLLPTLGASSEVESQLRNLASYRLIGPSPESDETPLSLIPKSRLASVLVLLYLSPDGRELRTTLTTRNKRMRSHPGETALPGGKFEPRADTTIEQTALREANEEVSLPLPPTAPLLHLTNLSPYTSRTLLIVVPCVYFLLLPPDEASQWLKNELKPSPDEVEAIFDCSLTRLLHLERVSNSPDKLMTTRSQATTEARRTTGDCIDRDDEERYEYTFTDYSWPLSPTTPYRLHSFSSPPESHPASSSWLPSAITGLTADILIDTASIAEFGPQGGSDEHERVGFVRRAEGQQDWREICKRALRIEWKKGDPGRGVEVLDHGKEQD